MWRWWRWRWEALAAVAAGGALGAAARYGLDLAWPHPADRFPWTTLVINVAGCAALGLLLEVLEHLSEPHRLARPFLGTGLLGGFTTFSAYLLQSQDLLAAGRPALAFAYLAGTLVAGLAAVWTGMMVVRLAVRAGSS